MDMKFMHPADQLVLMMNRIYNYGMTTTSGGNLSILDEDGNVWITPGSIDKGSLTRKDMVCIKKDGTIEGIHKPSSEYPFHLKVYETRSDIKAVLHAPPAGTGGFQYCPPDSQYKIDSQCLCRLRKDRHGRIWPARKQRSGRQDRKGI